MTTDQISKRCFENFEKNPEIMYVAEFLFTEVGPSYFKQFLENFLECLQMYLKKYQTWMFNGKFPNIFRASISSKLENSNGRFF